LLIVAGSLEGLVSPIPTWPLSAKLAVSATTAVLFAAYLRGGVHRRVSRVQTTRTDGALLALGGEAETLATADLAP
jgi:hypothetical protein